METKLDLTGSNWFALKVKPRHERVISRFLKDHGLEEFLPTYRSRRRWSDRFKEMDAVLFPGYVFSRFGFEDRLTVLGLPGVYSIVGFARKAAPVPENEIEAIRAIVRSPLRAGPWPFLRAGERVCIKDGPLAGVDGILLREKGVWRVVVSVELLQRSVAVEIDREMLSPAAALPRRIFPQPTFSTSMD